MCIKRWHNNCSSFNMEKDKKEIIEQNKKYIPMLEEYINTASPYPLLEEFCFNNKIDIRDIKQWRMLDPELDEKVRQLFLKAIIMLDKYLILDTNNISFGADNKKYKLDKKGLMYKLKELKELLNQY